MNILKISFGGSKKLFPSNIFYVIPLKFSLKKLEEGRVAVVIVL